MGVGVGRAITAAAEVVVRRMMNEKRQKKEGRAHQLTKAADALIITPHVIIIIMGMGVVWRWWLWLWLVDWAWEPLWLGLGSCGLA